MAVFSWFRSSKSSSEKSKNSTPETTENSPKSTEEQVTTTQASSQVNSTPSSYPTSSSPSTQVLDRIEEDDEYLDDEFLDDEPAPQVRVAPQTQIPSSSSTQAPTIAQPQVQAPQPEPQVQTHSGPKPAPQPETQPEPQTQASSPAKEEEFDEAKPKMSFFKRLVKGLSKTSNNIGANLRAVFVGKKIDSRLYEELEESLLSADVGWDTTDKVINKLQTHAKATELRDSEALYGKLKQELTEIIEPYAIPLDVTKKKPFFILMVGVNGVGKTTTIGKITRKLQANGLSVLLAAGDTFRAAAVEQLQEWGNRNNVPVIAQKTGSDSASVIYDAFNSAIAKGIDVIIADTAGRLQNKSHLLEELRKIVRVIKKLDPTAPHEVMITLDATTGQNAINQVEEFDKAVNITGITLTKLDGTGKGGVIFAICDKLHKPIRFIGVGEKIDDLQPFDAQQFIDALFDHKDQAN